MGLRAESNRRTRLCRPSTSNYLLIKPASYIAKVVTHSAKIGIIPSRLRSQLSQIDSMVSHWGSCLR